MCDFSCETVASVLIFVYTRELEITNKSVGPLIKCADELGICEIVHMCCEYLKCVCVDNAIYFYSIAENYNLADIRDGIYQFILDHFLDVAQTKHFQYVPVERLYKFLSDDGLNVTSEVDVFYVVACWIDFCREERLQLAAQLLQCAVRLQCISPEDLVTKIEPVEWIFENPECQAMLSDAIK